MLPSSDEPSMARLFHTSTARRCTNPNGSSARSLLGIPAAFALTTDAVGRYALSYDKSCTGSAVAGNKVRCGFATERLDSAGLHTAPWVLDSQPSCGADLRSCCNIAGAPTPSWTHGKPCFGLMAVLGTARSPLRSAFSLAASDHHNFRRRPPLLGGRANSRIYCSGHTHFLRLAEANTLSR